MSRYRSDPESLNIGKPSACSNCLYYSWKTISCLFSHATLITLVVSYCVMGAFTFSFLEKTNEELVKQNIVKIRENTTFCLWNFTNYGLDALREPNFTIKATEYLQDFEGALLKAINKDGWNGAEDPKKLQWTRTGALFYSIVVITTIGYGHLTPKTPWGKVVTIFYAIVGIPLMLLCLSKIGDVMATSFRFLYWRVCCYVCQKKPKRQQLKRGRSFKASVRNDSRLTRSKSASFRRPVRASGKFADGYGSKFASGYHSDPDLRRTNGSNLNKTLHPRGSSLPTKPNKYVENSSIVNNTLPITNNNINNNLRYNHGGTLNKKKSKSKSQDIELDPVSISNTPILCNKYVVGKNDIFANSNIPERRATSVPKTSKFLEVPKIGTPDYSSEGDDDSGSPIKSMPKIKPRRRSRSRSPMPPTVPKMMTPLGYGHRNKYLDDPDSDDMDDNDSYYEDRDKQKKKHVPIWLCVLLVISYILAGMYLFAMSENWEYLDAAYFCFITLTTIGFGDLVPAKAAVSQASETYDATISIALCSLYLLFGISLLAMSFNLVQEEVISNVKSVAKTLGIIKSDSDVSDDDDE